MVREERRGEAGDELGGVSTGAGGWHSMGGEGVVGVERSVG
jgi:hypothetical protein